MLPWMVMSSKDYVIIKIPKALADEIDAFLGKHGYKSRAELVKDAIRSLLREYGAYRKETA